MARSPNLPWPRPASTTYRDAGKARALPDVVAGLEVLCTRVGRGDDWCRRAVGLEIIPGYVIRATEGHAALAVRGEATPSSKRPMFGQPEPLATLTPDVWRAYAPVRVGASGEHHRVTWHVTAGRLTVRVVKHLHDDPVQEAYAWAPVDAGAVDRQFGLSDRFLWPARGVAWTLAALPRHRDGSEQGVALLAGEYAWIVMGLR